MTIDKNIILVGQHGKPILVDLFYEPSDRAKPIILFCHGYKGFKDWGAWNLMAKHFAQNGFVFIKFNFSHNGGTVEEPIDFPDLEAFGNNNYIKELDDLETVIDWVCANATILKEGDIENINLIGHSRGGGIVLIKADEDNRIKRVITLASVSDFGKRSSTTGDLERWKKDGVKYVLNGRTKQQMPHYYQFYENFKANEQRLTIKRAVKNLSIPLFIVHGDNDTSVSIEEGKALNKWNPGSKFIIIENADHVFGAKHPWKQIYMPKQLLEATKFIMYFIK